MSILVGYDTRLVVQGMSGDAGSFHARQMVEYGTRVVAGVTPGKGGAKVAGLEQVPMFDSVAEAVEKAGANTTVIYVPPPFAADSILEAAAAGIRVIIAITEGIPARDMVEVKYVLDHEYPEAILVGPNCPGVITPGQCKVGIMPGYIHKPGGVGVVSRSRCGISRAAHASSRTMAAPVSPPSQRPRAPSSPATPSG